jgi:hypothetical protein
MTTLDVDDDFEIPEITDWTGFQRKVRAEARRDVADLHRRSRRLLPA